VSASKQHGGDGFLFWNAANNYAKPFAAMPVMMANPKLYLQTPVATVQTAATTPDRGKDKEKDQPSASGQHP